MKRILSLGIALILLLSVGAVTAVAEEEKTLVVMPYMKTENCDLLSMSQAMDKTVQHAIFDGLWQYDSEGGVEGALVESWETSEDGTYISCKLREGVTFSDGTPFDADVVIWNYDMACQSDYLSSVVTTVISKIEKVDDYNVNIYKYAGYSSVEKLCCEYMLIMCPTAYEADPVAYQTNPIGTGAYVMESYDAATGYCYLTAREDSWHGSPAIKNVEVRVPLDSAVALVALENDEIQLAAPLISMDDLSIAESEGFQIFDDTGWSAKTVLLLGEPFNSDMNLTKAVYYAINAENAAIFDGVEDAVICEGLYAEKILEPDYVGEVVQEGYDPEKAAEYLAQSNYDGSTIEINVTADQVNVATSIQADLQTIGVNTEINSLDVNSWWQKMQDATVQITISDFGVAYTAPEEMMGYFVSDGFYGALGLTAVNETEEAELDLAAQEWTIEARKPHTVAAMKAALEQPQYFSLYEKAMAFAASPELEGIEDVWAATYNFHLWKLSWAE